MPGREPLRDVPRRGGDRSDRLVLGELAKQVGQGGRVLDVVAGYFYHPNLQRRLVHGEMDLAPHAPVGVAVLARVPFAFASDLDARFVHNQGRRSLRALVILPRLG